MGVVVTDIGLRNTCVFIGFFGFFGFGIAERMYFHLVFWVFWVFEKILNENGNGPGADLGSGPISFYFQLKFE